MKYFIYLILLLGFGVAQAQDEAAQKALDFIAAKAEALIAQNKVFNPVEQKAKVCQQYEDVKKTLSCEGEDCPPLYNSAVPLVLHFTASQKCSFKCVVGERMCDETLHPDDEDEGFLSNMNSRCSRSDDETVNPERFISYDDDGVKHIEEIKKYSDGCEEWAEYVEICNADGGECKEIKKYGEEWYEYERQKQLEAYEKSCFVATENDCKNIDQDMNQCVLDVTEQMSEFFCAPSTGNLWRYRKYGAEGGMFGFARSVRFKSIRKERQPSVQMPQKEYTNMYNEPVLTDRPTVGGDPSTVSDQ